ncbi:MAG: nucleotidyltransferase domain-containing protein [Candidatus Levyibacteriota bacterium]|nr:MAG: nucleotidyltransferase domain-containing protein [Candidatus Levybacteria bacterium]
MKKKIQFDKEKMAAIAKKHGLVFVVLFGSKARGEKPNAESDLDIAVLAKKDLSYKQYMNVHSMIADLFSGQNADVRLLNDTDLLFQHNVVRDGILLFGNHEEYKTYKRLIVRRYVDDGEIYFPMLDRLVFKQQEELERKIL